MTEEGIDSVRVREGGWIGDCTELLRVIEKDF
jgi:hypothetical protein